MSLDADARTADPVGELPREPRMLSWRQASRERAAKQRQLRRLLRRFARGE